MYTRNFTCSCACRLLQRSVSSWEVAQLGERVCWRQILAEHVQQERLTKCESTFGLCHFASLGKPVVAQKDILKVLSSIPQLLSRSPASDFSIGQIPQNLLTQQLLSNIETCRLSQFPGIFLADGHSQAWEESTDQGDMQDSPADKLGGQASLRCPNHP